MLKLFIKRFLGGVKIIANKVKKKVYCLGIAENVNQTLFNRNCLLLYIIEPFKMKIEDNHQNKWQVKELAKIVGEFGFNVDVINFDNKSTKVYKKYDLIIDIHPKSDSIYQNAKTKDCKVVAYLTGSNPSFSNKAELERLNALSERRKHRLKPRRYAPLFEKAVLEEMHAIFLIGNKTTLDTYSEFRFKNVSLIKNTGYEHLSKINWASRSPKNFLYFGSYGQVHKGLDLLLEVFSIMPDTNLYVCSDFKLEKVFCAIYQRELFELPNIHPIGFVDINGIQFKKILDLCCYVILPSCSEGMAGSVLTAMSAGLIPLVTRECGFENDEVHIIPDVSVEAISVIVDEFSNKTTEWIQQESSKTLQLVKSRFSQCTYSDSIRKGLAGLFDTH